METISKEGHITIADEVDAHNQATKVLQRIKAARKGKVYRMEKVAEGLWREIEVKTNIKNITS